MRREIFAATTWGKTGCIDARLGEIETALAEFEDRPISFDPAEIARAGVFVSIDSDGSLSVDRGYVRPEDEAPARANTGDGDGGEGGESSALTVQRPVITIGGQPKAEEDQEDTVKPF